MYSNELVALRRLASSKIVGFVNASDTAIYTKKDNRGSYGAMYICTEYAKLGTMFDFMLRVKQLPEHLARVYFVDLVKAMEVTQAAGIVHGDVRLENLLVDINFKLQLADFGRSQPIADTDEDFLPL